ncbi:MAG: hypothetical protein HFF98_06780 [Oscillibacter sp.]|jgi:hypothetical protein|nr:hypothetical protein [Oscillibacter sp.]
MDALENLRLIEALQGAGWTDTEIKDFILWVETGEEQYKPEKESRNEARVSYGEGGELE